MIDPVHKNINQVEIMFVDVLNLIYHILLYIHILKINIMVIDLKELSKFVLLLAKIKIIQI